MTELNNEQETIIGKFSYLLFPKNFSENDPSKYAIINVLTDDKKYVVVKGSNLPLTSDYRYKFIGKYQKEKTGRISFSCEYVQLVYPTNKSDIELFLKKNIKKVGAVKAKQFTQAYGDETLEAIKDYDKVLAVVKNQKTAQTIIESANEVLADSKLFFLLSKFSIQSALIAPIVKDFSNDAFEVIHNNPFILSNKYNVNFLKVNAMAISLDVGLNSEERIMGAIKYILKEKNNGSCYFLLDSIIEQAYLLLNSTAHIKIEKKQIYSVLIRMRTDDYIKIKKGKKHYVVMDSFIDEAEKNVANRLISMTLNSLSSPSYDNMDKVNTLLNQYEKENNIELSTSQKEAVEKAIKYKCSVITGSAGTGKTTVLKACLFVIKRLFNMADENISLIAPTGRAARRMTELTGHQYAYTIHSALGINENCKYYDVNTPAKIDAEYVFIDEMSMTDIVLFYKLLTNSQDYTRFILIGDPNQLPSVGAGNVLKDIINSKLIPVTKLDVIYRQTQESLIIYNANNILQNISKLKTGNDFQVHNYKDSVVVSKIVDEYISEFENVGNIFDVQIISPMKKGEVSTYNLNNLIQSKINPISEDEKYIKINGYRIHRNDKVICNKNTDTIKNGDIGIVNLVYLNDVNSLTVEIKFLGFDIQEFTKDELLKMNLTLAHAITVHKSQGSEFKSIILPIANENKSMLNRKLLYTAVTRAKEKFILFGNQQLYNYAVNNTAEKVRNTLLAFYIKAFAKKLVNK